VSAGQVLAAVAAVALTVAAILGRRRGLVTTPLAIGGVALYVFVAYTVQIASDPGPAMFDNRVLGIADDLRSGFGLAVAKVVTAFGSLPAAGGFVLLAVVLLGVRRRPAEAAVLVASALAIVAAVHVAKTATGRPRPPHPLAGSTLSAFPSGHAAYSTFYVAMAATAARVLQGAVSRATLVTLGVVVAVAIGLSRAYLRVHWWSDVVAGWALGAAIFGLVTAAAVVVGHIRNNHRGTPAAAGAGRAAADRA
jgi:undecaprenyl-diphosphatase